MNGDRIRAERIENQEIKTVIWLLGKRKAPEGQNISSLRSMVFKEFYHPGSASNAYLLRLYPNFEDVRDAARIGFAPYMRAYYSHGIALNAEWPYLELEKSYSEQYAKNEAKKKQPEADLSF